MIEIKHRFTDAVLHTVDAETLSEADLSEADLSEADLSGADLSGADLRGADLSGAYLRGTDLSGAYLRGTDLSGADLSGAYLSGADLSGAYLSGAYLSGTDNILRIGPTSDGYEFFAVPHDETVMLRAGCHWFTWAEASEYYGKDKRPVGPERRAFLALIKAVAEARDWKI